jgi:hypothetical protein
MNDKTGKKIVVFLKLSFNLIFSSVAACLIGMMSLFPPAAEADDKTEDAPQIREEDKLPGVLYDLKWTSDGISTHLTDLQDGKQFNRMRTALSVWNLPDTSGKESVMVPFLKRFVLSNWPYRTDSAGNLFFREFSQFSRSSVSPNRAFFYQPSVSSDTAPKVFSNDRSLSGAGWVGIHSGYVVAPFTGKFRFVGYGNDALAVRFNGQLVLDYGCYALSLGKRLDSTWDYLAILSGTAARTDPQKRMVLENPIYSKCKLDRYSTSLFDNHGLAKGVPVNVIQGQCYPIEILVSDIENNSFCMALFAEQLDSNGKPIKENPAKLPLFRTTSELPPHPGGSFPDFDEDSPIWKVVDARGKTIPSRYPIDPTTRKNSDPAQQQKSVTRTTQDNVTTETVVEQDGDTTIETVTTTEEKDNAANQTVVRTERKNGIAVKRTTSTSTTVTVELFPFPDMSPAGSDQTQPEKTDEPPSGGTSAVPSENKTEKTDAKPSSGENTTENPSSGNKTDPPARREKYNPFGYTRPFDEEEQ